MNVYDEYVKNQSGPDDTPAPQSNEAENLNPTAEEVKDTAEA